MNNTALVTGAHGFVGRYVRPRDVKALSRKIARVFRPGGRLVGAREHVVSDPRDILAFQAGHPLHHLYGGEYAYRLEAYQTALTGAGLKLTQVLNAFESDVNVNLFPASRAEVRYSIAGKFDLPMVASLVPGWLRDMRGRNDQTPGAALYLRRSQSIVTVGYSSSKANEA